MISSLTTNVSRRCRVLPLGQQVQAFVLGRPPLLTRLASRSLSTTPLHIHNNLNLASSDTRRFYSSTPNDTTTTTTTTTTSESSPSIFSTPSTFQSIGIQSPVLLDRLQALGFHQPTRIQEETVPQWHSTTTNAQDSTSSSAASNTLILGSETGSGKTLAYLLPLLDQLLLAKQKPSAVELEPLAKAIILVPNKELIQQVLRMAIPLCGTRVEEVIAWGGGVPMPTTTNMTKVGGGRKDTIRLAVLPGGLMEPNDFPPFQHAEDPTVDILITTPASLGPWGLKPKHVSFFADVETLVIDEADMLLDGGYRKPLERVLVGFQRADKLHLDKTPTRRVFCAATLPDMGLKSVDSFLKHKFPRAQRLCMSGMHQARHFGLKQPTQWVGPLETKKERMDDLIELLRTPIVDGGLQGEKVMIFLNSVGDVEGASGALARAGFDAVEYHAKLKLDERSHNLDRFRAYNSPTVPEELVTVESVGKSSNSHRDTSPVPILICTDLASRGLDIPGVTAVVQLQFSGNVVSHLHRMGRCGRAGQRIGRGIVYYGSTEAELVEMVRDAEDQQERMLLPGDVEDVVVEEGGGEANHKSKGNIDKAFSRKRGLSRKRKKRLREGEQHA
eukprot:Nitzschia sp. Nitz4//scaffold414_size9364//7244//9088//NITZ4_009101-RA/size9364-processed-gene-0.6-mRNA-1//-1//CDS//3329551356//172//frame0